MCINPAVDVVVVVVLVVVAAAVVVVVVVLLLLLLVVVVVVATQSLLFLLQMSRTVEAACGKSFLAWAESSLLLPHLVFSMPPIYWDDVNPKIRLKSYLLL